jgi:hypothetical protein
VALRGRMRSAASEGGATATIWFMVVACHVVGGDLGREGGRVVGSSCCVLEGAIRIYVGVAAPDELVSCLWSVADCSG